MIKIEKARKLLELWEYPDYRYRQLCRAVFENRVGRFMDMTDLPKELREKLRKALGETVLTLTPEREELSGQADKVLFRLPAGGCVETVRLHYKTGWESYCISSQSGCAFGCRFCATGAMGTVYNLTEFEIVEQLLYFHLKGYPLQSVSFMGMGEPFANPRLFQALSLLTDLKYFGLGSRRITVSTVGVIPGIRRLSVENPQINLAYSLHAPNGELRKRLMPVENRFPMGKVLETLDWHIKRTNKRVFLAYTLMADRNDSPAHAAELARLLRQRPAQLPLYRVDLIPYNETAHGKGLFRAPSKERVKAFASVLKKAGVSCDIRTQFGADIHAACGQLAGEKES